jgi:hypothetical protein
MDPLHKELPGLLLETLQTGLFWTRLIQYLLVPYPQINFHQFPQQALIMYKMYLKPCGSLWATTYGWNIIHPSVHLINQCGRFSPNKNLLNTRRQSGRFSSNKISYLTHLRANNLQATSKCLLKTYTSFHCFFGPAKVLENIIFQQPLCLCWYNSKNFSFVKYSTYPT